MKPKQGSGSGTYGPGSIPTKPMVPRVQEPVGDETEPTQQRCPLCVGHGYVSPEIAIAFEHFCNKLREER